ncbi:deoxyribose-phosphate aldolase [Aliiglaciecola litoralis]|uniref:Deoxyribose-phosphate aldolase n=1 Tax=Aliiglaciecola litoralis TaxID=582857 RepID=A0ABP3X2S2_9ALTE
MKIETELAQKIISLIDLTSLSGNETLADVIQICQSAMTPYGNTAAVCVYPNYVQTAKNFLAAKGCKKMKVATVVNFPSGQQSIKKVVADTQLAIKHGADEIDIVLPYHDLITGNVDSVTTMLSACKQACTEKAALKVIIESGELGTPELVKAACQLSLNNGADFIKTSTGKVPVNATLEAATWILESIKESGNKQVGIKISGGVKTYEQAVEYLTLTQKIMGDHWIDSDHVRFGASSLLMDVMTHIEQTSALTSRALK